MKRAILIIIPVLFLFNTCALEIANVIGPGGGYVFYDMGNYSQGWRYLECSPFDIGELKDIEEESIKKAMDLCDSHSGGWYKFNWELPEEADLKKMLECFSYGLTRFSPDYYYLAVNKPSRYEKPSDAKYSDEYDPLTWEAVILHKNFDEKLNGEVTKVNITDLPAGMVIKIRPIRRF